MLAAHAEHVTWFFQNSNKPGPLKPDNPEHVQEGVTYSLLPSTLFFILFTALDNVLP